ncbi:MAG: carbohydrate ABC transporter permease [Chloroflexota bacterium]
MVSGQPVALSTAQSRSRGSTRLVSRAALYLLALVVTLLFVIPFAWMVLSSFKLTAEVFRYASPLTWKTFIPPDPTLSNFYVIFEKFNFHRSLMNSVIAALGQTSLTLVVCSLAAFVFARLQFRGRDLLFGLVVLSAFIPFEAIMVPLYVVTRQLGLVDTYAGLFLPWVANAAGIFLLRQSFIEIPREYDEAAMMEGASPVQVLWHVILPNSRPSLVTLALISALASWNSFLWPLIVIQDQTKQLVQVAIATFTDPGQLPTWGELFAGATVATVPVLIVFLALQRFYVRGMVMSGIKG